ncbi:PIN domain-containing protein [Mycobacterium sp.]|uniref:PIN domain-containing protein n=1 Tax=Mycobacterium sp. TaxID=1785 RepID=UPI003C78A7D1
MAVTARFLIDTSAVARMSNPDVGRRVSPLIQGGVVATTASLDAEALYSARGPAEYEQLWNDRRLAYEYLPTNDEHWQIALDAQRELARTGRHRAVGVHDLLTAAIAAAHNLIVVHYDSDFETAATVLTFQHVWVLPRGTVP